MSILLTTFTVLLLASCSNSPADAASNAVPPIVRTISEAADGPHTLQLLLEGPEKPDVTTPLTLTIRSTYPAGSTLRNTDFSQEKASSFKVTPIQNGISPKVQPDGSMLILQQYLLDPWIADSYLIPEVKAEFADSKGVTVTVTAPARNLEIAQLPEEFWQSVSVSDRLAPYRKMPLTAAQKRRIAIITLCTLLAAAVLTALAVKWLRSYLRRRRHGPPPETPYARAMRRLDELVQMRLIAKGEFKQYCIVISDIMRQYIEGRFNLSAPRLTTQEFMEQLSNSEELLQMHRAALRRFMTACDMVKFAAVIPGDGETDELALLCRDFLNHTNDNVPS